MSLSEIDFGYASAQAEATKNPTLLTEGYLDAFGIGDKVAAGHEWLVLGYKGSGKSAVAERFNLQHQADAMTFVNLLNLEDFEFARFLKLAPGCEPLETELPTAWSWLLYVFILKSLFRDNGLATGHEHELSEIRAAFRSMGLSQVSNLNEFVRLTTERSFKLSVPNVATGQWKRTSEAADVDLRWYVLNLRPLISSLRSDSFTT